MDGQGAVDDGGRGSYTRDGVTGTGSPSTQSFFDVLSAWREESQSQLTETFARVGDSVHDVVAQHVQQVQGVAAKASDTIAPKLSVAPAETLNSGGSPASNYEPRAPRPEASSPESPSKSQTDNPKDSAREVVAGRESIPVEEPAKLPTAEQPIQLSASLEYGETLPSADTVIKDTTRETIPTREPVSSEIDKFAPQSATHELLPSLQIVETVDEQSTEIIEHTDRAPKSSDEDRSLIAEQSQEKGEQHRGHEEVQQRSHDEVQQPSHEQVQPRPEEPIAPPVVPSERTEIAATFVGARHEQMTASTQMLAKDSAPTPPAETKLSPVVSKAEPLASSISLTISTTRTDCFDKQARDGQAVKTEMHKAHTDRIVNDGKPPGAVRLSDKQETKIVVPGDLVTNRKKSWRTFEEWIEKRTRGDRVGNGIAPSDRIDARHPIERASHTGMLSNPRTRQVLADLVDQFHQGRIPNRDCRDINKVVRAVRELEPKEMRQLVKMLDTKETGTKFYEGLDLATARKFHRVLDVLFENYSEEAGPENERPAANKNAVQMTADAIKKHADQLVKFIQKPHEAGKRIDQSELKTTRKEETAAKLTDSKLTDTKLVDKKDDARMSLRVIQKVEDLKPNQKTQNIEHEETVKCLDTASLLRGYWGVRTYCNKCQCKHVVSVRCSDVRRDEPKGSEPPLRENRIASYSYSATPTRARPSEKVSTSA